MSELQDLYRKHAEWQKKRITLSWPEKIRLAEAAQETLRRFRELKADAKTSSRERGGGANKNP